jgi:hypothetical protein
MFGKRAGKSSLASESVSRDAQKSLIFRRFSPCSEVANRFNTRKSQDPISKQHNKQH